MQQEATSFLVATTRRLVIPAQAGIQQRPRSFKPRGYWIPACAGMTSKAVGRHALHTMVRLRDYS
jgi:hypothetical protein